MPELRELRSSDGRYLFAMQGDGNEVVYIAATMTPVWDRWSYEASQPGAPPTTAPPAPIATPPDVGSIGSGPAPAPPGLSPGGGGFVESRDTNSPRPRLTRDAIARFVPASRGAFRFPDPYGTRGIRLTNEVDGALTPREYSYWRQINNHAGRDTLFVLIDLDNRPMLLEVDKARGTVANRGPLGDFSGTAEGWYFSATRPTALYLIQGGTFCRYDVEAQRLETVYQAPPGLVLWQPSSSDDDQVHAATLQRPVASGPYETVGAIVCRGAQVQVVEVDTGGYDECQLDKSGRYLIVKENDDNVVHDLWTGGQARVTNGDGAVGHSDTGVGFVAGEDDQHEACACVRWDLANPTTRTVLHTRPDWAGGMGHNAIVRNDRVLIANALGQDLARVNELVVVRTDGSPDVLVVAPSLMIDLSATSVPYDLQVKANVDPLGQFALWYANGAGRLDAFLVELPSW